MKKHGFDVGIIILICLYLLLPLIIAFIYSISTSWTGILPGGFTLKHYVTLFNDERFLKALVRTVVLCIAPITIMVIVVLFALFAIITHYPRLEKYFQLFSMIPYALQGIILSVSIISIFAGKPTIFGQRIVMLTGAYCILILPYIYQGLRNAFYSINVKTLMESSSMLGGKEVYTFFKVIIPNMLPGIIVVSLLSMSIIIGDFVLINTIAGSNYENVQMFLFKTMSYSSGESSATFILIFAMIMVITVLVLIFQRKIMKKYER